MSSSVDGASVVSEGPTMRKYRFKTSIILLGASYIGLMGLITLVISFSSPYWLSSHKYTYSSFVRLGLWTFCFDHYKHPPYQYDETFTGCRWIYDPKYHNIRDWLQPGWFIFVQVSMTFSLIFSVSSLLTISIPIMHFAIRYNVILICLGFLLKTFAALFGFMGWLIFAIKHDTRSWLMNPRFNHLDWSFYMAVLSSLFNAISAIMLAFEIRRARARRQRFTNLVYNMHPRSPSNGYPESIPLKTPPPPETLRVSTVQAPPPPGRGSFSRSPDSIHSSPYASISRFSQGQQQQQQQPTLPPPRPQYQTTKISSPQRHFTAV